MSTELPVFTTNRRIIPVNDNNLFYMKLALLITCGATTAYKRRVFAHDKNLFNVAMYGVAVLYGTVCYTKAIFDPPSSEAARANNRNELEHQRAMGLI